MGTTNSTPNGFDKVKGIQLPGQSGKTRKMEDKVTEFMNLARSTNSEDDINILVTSNNKILVSQTSTRFNRDLGPSPEESSMSEESSVSSSNSEDDDTPILAYGSGPWTSSNKLDVNGVVARILTDEISMLVCCANARRFKKLLQVLDTLQAAKRFKGGINIWLDEAHKYIKLLKRFIHIISYPKVKSVTLVSATWDPIDKIYNCIRRIPYEITHPDVYRSLHECTWVIVEPLVGDRNEGDEDSSFDSATTAPGYIAQIIHDTTLWNTIEKPGACWLIPGNSKTSTHEAIADDLTERGWNGLVLNGQKKEFLCIHGKNIDYSEYRKDTEEPKDVLERVFVENPSLREKPFFITGLNCLKEGITFQGEGFMLDGGILPPMNNASDAYQLACRLAGNVKGFSLYETHTSPMIITSSKMEKKIKRQENIAIFLPRILYQEGRDVPTEIDKNRAARGNVAHDPMGLGYRVFSKYEMFRSYVRETGGRTQFNEEPNGKDEYAGKHVCSVQSRRGSKQQPRYLTEVIDKIDLAYGGGGATRTAFPCYLDVTQAPTGLVWLAVVSTSSGNVESADSKYPDESTELLRNAVNYLNNP